MKKYRDVLEFFNRHLPDLKPNKKLKDRLKEFRLQWSTKDDEYIEFLGSNLIGVHEIRFSALDDDRLMNIYGVGEFSAYTVKAPISGFITEKFINENMQFRMDNTAQLFTIANFSFLIFFLCNHQIFFRRQSAAKHIFCNLKIFFCDIQI